MININYIISVYKTQDTTKGFYEINVKLYSNNYPTKQIYDTPKLRDEKFDKLIKQINDSDRNINK